MKEFRLEILTPERAFYVGPCLSLVLPVSDGQMGIQAGRAPLCAAIEDGQVRFTLPDGEVKIAAVTKGIINVTPALVRMLCETALRPEEIDTAREQERLLAATRAQREKQSHKEYLLSQLAIEKAIHRLQVAHSFSSETQKEK